MNRDTLPRLSRVIAVSAIAIVTLTGAGTPKQVHPTSGGDDAPFVIAVISDHYLATQEAEFGYDVENFFNAGLLVDGFYSTHAAKMRIVSAFEATPAGQASSYDFTIAPGAGNCAVTDGPDTAKKIQDVVAGLGVDHTVIIGNYPYNFGCTKGDWTYVAVDAVGTDVLQHEFGHVIAGLYDEWGLASNGTTPFPYPLPATERRNCALAPWPPNSPPYWSSMPNVVNDPGCRLYNAGVVHPFHDCRMGASHHAEFCEVCKLVMNTAFEDMVKLTDFPDNPNIGNPPITGPQGTNPAPPPAPSHASTARPRFGFVNAAFVAAQPVSPKPTPPAGPGPILRMLVNFDPVKRVLSAKKGYPVVARYTPSYRKLGQYAYEILDFDRTVEVGVLPDRLFEARGYRGGGTQHQVSTPQPTDVVIQIPNMDAKAPFDPKRSISMKIYLLLPTVQQQMITPAVFAGLKAGKLTEQVAQLTADQIRAAF